MQTKSIEPKISHFFNTQLQKYNLDYKLEQETLNTQIDKAFELYESKSGGKGKNRPDVKLLKSDKRLNTYPVIIEYKGYIDKLVKFNNKVVDNKTKNNETDYNSIKSYAVNGAVHYANAILQHTDYKKVIAIGCTGKEKNDILQTKIGVYLVSDENYGLAQEIGEYDDLSFLDEKHFDEFVETIYNLSLSEKDLKHRKEIRDKQIDISLTKLNNDIYKDEENLTESDRVNLIASSIMATLGIPNEISPLTKEELKCKTEPGFTDGDILINKINAFLKKKKIPVDKADMIVRKMKNTLLKERLNKPKNGETQLKRVFSKIVDCLGEYYQIGLNTDFTGKLFNEMYSWLGYTDDKWNDVVLTPSYVATLLVKLAKVNMNSFVWDFATGSAGLLVAAMNEMINDAKRKLKSPSAIEEKILHIKANQLLGIEILEDIYMLAILNMILMGDGSSNILCKDSLTEFNGNYGFDKSYEKFPADAFVLNPPYSKQGNGMVFVERAFSMMTHGYGSVIIQSSAGNGKATEYNKKILERNTLLASIKMPADIFGGKSSVQTHIYVFKIGEPHNNDNKVKFIDFSNDGYKRTNRKKAKINLLDIDRANQRYNEIVDLVLYGEEKLNIFTKNEYYEGYIDVLNGNDWNQSAPVDKRPTLDDFKENISSFLAWEVSNILKSRKENENVKK
ncbi:SAM-dependent DNA methyltransferase [Mycoplasma feriruminatoris]|uniref:site-specific DNA-methyltransferase (adenine-specific) n=1 Tax=Mycoplasma feriruminatoris TaxID=1179777 RepID=A0ABY8HUV6_9MOLU|nr:N-6 DNA methylase [Mycoplasma feriruminatoris]WFQ93378.1 SAM-dependent DNA methyltransferase [Mycoplasma feriruminatoris]